MSGRLTLTWANKERALLSHGETGYEWVEQDDPRVREVRLLDEDSRVGEVEGDARDNLLIRGDSLDALRALVRSPEYADVYRGKVKLVYIDPPFNTGQAFEHYDDSLEHSVWLGMMRERLVLIRDLLAPDGSVWVHLDDAEMAYCRVLMDEVFGRSNFVATVVWQKVYSPKNSARHLSVDQDYMLLFARDAEIWRPEPLQRSESMDAAYKNPDQDLRGVWKAGDLLANKSYSLGRYSITTPSGRVIEGPPPGRYWRVSQERLAELDADGRIWWGTAGENVPAIKRFLTEVRGRVPQTLWLHEEVGHSQSGKNEVQRIFDGIEPFSTPKPERLLERVIHIGSNPGDIVLDCFAGSGTTAAVAHKMGRRWVTVELSENTADTFTKPRLEKVVAGADLGGITESAGWAGGGGFRDLRIAPSVWDVIDDNLGVAVFQDESVDDATYIRSVTAQLGYSAFEHPVFCGQKGRSRLVVATGVIDSIAVADIVSALGEGETVLIAALSNTEDAPVTLRELSRGSRILRTPSQLFPTRSRVTT